MKRSHIPPSLRKQVLERDKYTCRYCGNKTGPFHLDHVYPVSKGGETSYGNLVTSCEFCNLEKRSLVGIFPKPVGYFDKEKFRRFWLFWSSVSLGILLAILGLFTLTETNKELQKVEWIIYGICWIPFLLELPKMAWQSTLELWEDLKS